MKDQRFAWKYVHMAVAISHLSPLSLISSSLIHSLRCYSSLPLIPFRISDAPSAPRQHLRDAYSPFDTHMMRSSLAQEISAFAVAVRRRSSLSSFPFISPFNYPEGWRRQRRAAAGGEEGEGARAENCRSRDRSLVSGDPKAKPKWT